MGLLRHQRSYQKLLKTEKEIVREVVPGDQHNLRKSANRNAQISVIRSAHCTDLCFAICWFSKGSVCQLGQLHAQSPFLFPIVVGINLIPFFVVCSVLAVLSPRLFVYSMCCFTWAAARSQQLLFVVLEAGLWCFIARCYVKSPLFQAPLKQKCVPRLDPEKDRRLFAIHRSSRISTSYKFAAPHYRLPGRVFRWASNLAFQRHWKIPQSCRGHKDYLNLCLFPLQRFQQRCLCR